MIPDIPYANPLIKSELSYQNYYAHKDKIGNLIEIEWQHKKYDFVKNIFEFFGGVKIYYQDFVITSENAWFNLENQTGGTSSQIKIVHKDGSMEAENFYWEHDTSKAEKITFTVGGLKGICDTSLFEEKKIILENLFLGFEPAGIVKIRSPYCEIRNKSILLKKPHFNVLGLGFQIDQKEFKGKDKKFNLALPQIKIRRSKLGVSWFPQWEINNRLLIAGNIQTSAWQSLGLSGLVSMRFRNKSPFTGACDLEDPFLSSYLDNIATDEKKHEIKNLATKRFNLRLMSGQNLEASSVIENKKNIFTISKPYDIQMDLGGIKHFPINFQFQAQSIKQTNNTPLIKRKIVSFQAIPLMSQINENVQLTLRADGRYSQGALKRWGWMRGLIGLQISAPKEWGLGIGLSRGKLFGHTHFDFDHPFSLNNLHFRLFYKGTKYYLRYLTRYSFDKGRWYDHQLKMGWTWGAFEPYILYTSNFRNFNVGIELKIPKLLN